MKRLASMFIIAMVFTMTSATAWAAVPDSGKGAPLRERQDEAVLAARSGNYEKALSDLSELRREYPNDQRILADYLTVSSWAGRDAETMRLAGGLNPKTAPDYALSAVASSFRKTGNFKEARFWYEEALPRFPGNFDLRLGLALTMGELAEPERGLRLLQDVDEAKISDAEQKHLADARHYLQRMIPPPPPYEIPARVEFPWRAQQDSAVQLAREGKLNEALAILADLHQQYPQDQYLLGDYLVLLRWVPDHDRVLALAKENQDLAVAPAYAVAAVVHSMAAKQDYYQARQYMDAALQAQRRRPELLAIAAEISAMHGNYFVAADWLDEAEASRVPGLGHLTSTIKRVQGYERVRSLRDLESANRQLAANPKDTKALWLKTVALSGVGGAHEARSMDQQGAGLTPAESHNIGMAAGRKESRWGELVNDIRDQDTHNRWFEVSLGSLSALADQPDSADESLRSLAEGPDPAASADVPHLRALQARQATVQPLYQLDRLKEATDVYEDTVAAGSEPTDAVLLSAGGAYIAQRQPLEAVKAYQSMLDRRGRVEPEVRGDDIYEAESGLFWAYLESEQLRRARKQAWDGLNNAVSPPPEVGRPLPDNDWRKPAYLNTAGLAELFTGWHGKAEDHFDAILAKSPANTGALNGRSMALSMRGLPRAAWEDAVVARLYAPDSLALAIREAHTLLDLREWRAAERLIEELAPWSPYNGSVEQLERRWKTHNLREFRFSTDWAQSDSDNPGIINGGDTPSISARLYSQPLRYNWRVFAGANWDAGEFAEGDANQDIVLGGIQYSGRDLEFELEVRSDKVEDRDIGVGISGLYERGDHWRFPFSFQILSPETPLRARRSGITADAASLGLQYYWNDYRWMNFNTTFMDFSDGNQRMAFSGNFNQRLWTWYTQYLNGSVNVGFSSNSEDAERPYFNPEEDREIGVGLTYGSVLWRKYDRSLRHEITAGVADYWQKNYGSNIIWNVGYSQSVDWGDRFSVTYGVGYARRVYDGDSERDFSAFLNLVRRF